MSSRLRLRFVAAMLLANSSLYGQFFFPQSSKLTATGGIGAGSVGWSVALSSDGTTAIAGAPTDNGNVGAAYVYTRSGNTWTQQARITAADGSGAPSFGTSVAISADGNTAAVGGPFDGTQTGAAFIFTRSGSTWTQQGAKLIGSGATGAAQQGTSVALSSDGNTLAIGGKTDNTNAGAVWVFTRSSGAWTQQGTKLTGTGAVGSARQGSSVALSGDGNTLACGGPMDNAEAGAIWIFTRSSNSWSQQGSKLKGSAAGTVTDQGFSISLSGDGNTLVDGAPFDGGTNTGAAWVFTRSSGVWTQFGSALSFASASSDAELGYSVATNSTGNLIVVGGPGDSSATGAVWVFTRGGSGFTQRGSKLVGAGNAGASQQGAAVALSADGVTILSGGAFDNSQVGAVWPFGTARLSVTISATSQTGSPVAFSVVARDAGGNTLTSYVGTVTFSSSDGLATLPSSTALVNGVGSFSATFNTVGSQTLTANDSGASAITGSASINVTPLNVLITVGTSPANLAFTFDGTTYTSAQTFNVLIGSSHTVAVASPLNGTTGTRYVYSNWSDSGAISHSIVAPSSPVSITANYTTQYQLTVAASPVDGGTVSPASGSFYNAGSAVPISASPSGPYTFTGWSGPVASGSSTSTTVTMSGPTIVTAQFRILPPAPGFSVSPNGVNLTYYQGTTPTVYTQLFGVDSGDNTVTFQAVASANWIAVRGGRTGGTVPVQINLGALPVGVNSATIVFSTPDQTVTVPIIVTVFPRPTLSVNTPSQARAIADGAPQTQTVQLASTQRPAAFTLASDARWLSVDSDRSITPAQLKLTANPSGLAGGTYTARVTVTAPDATNNPLTFNVTLVVNGVRGAGNNANGDATVAPNTILNLYGTGLSCIGTSSATVNGVDAPVLYTSSGQVSIVIPQAGPIVAAATRDAGSHDASIHWMCNGVEIGSIDVPLATAAPALYTLAGNGTGQALMLNQDYTLNSPGNAAKRGSYVSFFGTGFGSLGLAGLDGLRRLTSTVTASVGGVAALVVYAGETPGFTQALQQIVVQIPDNAATGIAQPIVVTADGVATPYGVMFAIQ